MSQPAEVPNGVVHASSDPLAGRNRILVIGASAGGVEALSAVVRGIPASFQAPILIVLHLPPRGNSRPPEILDRVGSLPVAHATHGERIVGGPVYVAPADVHLLVHDGHVARQRGPRENHSRPAIDPLFRSAARAYGPAAIGVILSGALYDGAAGLLALTHRGGIGIVQDPLDAGVDVMPRSALRLVEADYILPAAEIGPLLDRLVESPVPEGQRAMVEDDQERISEVLRDDIAKLAMDHRSNELRIYTCPDCGGSLWQSSNGWESRYVCHVGHAYGPELLLGQKSEELEGALWTCVRLLTGKATLARQVAARSMATGDEPAAARVIEQAEADERHARLLREMLAEAPVAAGYVNGARASGDNT